MESQFDPTKIKRAEVVIKGLLAEHGRQFATVKPTYERIAATNAVKLVFNIDEGPESESGRRSNSSATRPFPTGNSSARCTTTAPTRFRSTSRTFRSGARRSTGRKLDEDLEVGIRGIYQDHGYFKVSVSDPDAENSR